MEQIYSKKELFLRKPIILISLSSGVLSFLLTIFAANNNMNAISIGGLFSIVSFLILILKPLVGRASDKIGRKPLFAASMLIYSAAFLCFAFARSSITLYLARGIQALAAVLYTISTYGIITDTYDKNNLSEGFGGLSAFASTGILYGFLLTSLVFSNMMFFEGWSVLFYSFAIAGVIAFILVLKKVPETKTHIKPSSTSKKKLTSEAIKILFVNFITSASSSMLSPIILIYLMDKFPNNFNAVSFAYLSSIMVASILGKRIGIFGDSIGKKKSLVLGLLIGGVVSIIIPNTNSMVLLGILWCIQVVGNYLEGPAESGIYSIETDDFAHGEMYGIYSSVGSCGAIVGPLLGGFLYEKISHTMAFYVDGIVFLTVGILCIWLIKNQNISTNTNINSVN